MKRILLITVMAGALALSACGNKSDEALKNADGTIELSMDGPKIDKTYASAEEEVADRIVVEVQGIVAVLDTVKDEASAQQAAKYIEAAARRLDGLYEKYDGKIDEAKMREQLDLRRDDVMNLQKDAMVKVGKMFVFRGEEAQLLMTELEKIDWTFLDGPKVEVTIDGEPVKIEKEPAE